MKTEKVQGLAVGAGVNIHWLEKGTGDTLVFLPGSNGDYRTWSQQWEYFSSRFRVIAVSRRYQYPDRYRPHSSSTVEENCHDLYQLLVHLNIPNITLVGHSFGGYVALAFAQKYGGLVQKLILEEPAVFPFIMRKSFNPLRLIPLFFKDFTAATSFMRTGLKGIRPTRTYLAAGEFEQAKLAFVNGIIGHAAGLESLNPLMRQGLDDNIGTFTAESQTAFSYPLTLKQIKNMGVETLLLQSDKSPHWFSYICQQLSHVMPHAQLRTISARTHWLHLDEAELFNAAIIKFMDGQK